MIMLLINNKKKYCKFSFIPKIYFLFIIMLFPIFKGGESKYGLFESGDILSTENSDSNFIFVFILSFSSFIFFNIFF